MKLIPMLFFLVVTASVLAGCEDARFPSTGNVRADAEEKAAANAADEYEAAMFAYRDFLLGELLAAGTDGGAAINIDDIFYAPYRQDAKFVLFDVNGDELPELHLRTPVAHMVLSHSDNKLSLWYEGSSYDRLMDNGAILYHKSDVAPAREIYVYREFGKYGELLPEIYFEKLDGDDDGNYDTYKHGDEIITEKEWEERTALRFWGSDAVMWMAYSAWVMACL
ncbi:MAG: hypothetical protein LBP30_03725 [Clostridiales Family XIII bacterium]|jgi:hypothetical protein|nr:hypothetical protein [Clostridiales Family XIII bacterium]